jgi:hypothetical protein
MKAWVVTGLLLATGCSWIPSEKVRSKVVIVFVDISKSTENLHDIFRRAWQKIVAKIEPGDRILLASISDATLTGFEPACDEEVVKTEWYEQPALRRRQYLAATRRKLEQAMDTALESQPSARTEILNALLIAERVFDRDPRRHVLVILSDMIEDAHEHDFKRASLGAAEVRRIIAALKAKGRLADLRGVEVYVSGATAPTASRALAIQSFWVALFAAGGARLEGRNYGHCLLDFDRGR